MAKLPPIRRLSLEEFSTQKAWIEPLLTILNSFTESTVTALNKGLTLADNSTGDTKEFQAASMPTRTNPINIAWTKNSTPKTVNVGQVSLVSGADVTLTAAPAVQWSFNGTVLQITNILGVTPSPTNIYTITLLITAG